MNLLGPTKIADCLENLYSVLELKIKLYIKYVWWLYDYIIFYFVTDAKANQNGKLIIWPLISFRLGRCSRIRKVLFLLRDITKILSKCIMSTVYKSYKRTIRNTLLSNYVIIEFCHSTITYYGKIPIDIINKLYIW